MNVETYKSEWQKYSQGDRQGFCQNKPPCPTALWKLTNQVCPILYLSVISKLVLRLFNLQLCCM